MDTHYELLYRFLWRLTASPEAAAELTQDAFVRALERLDSFDGRARFSTWLHAIALNVWRDSRRRQARQIEAAEEQARTAAVPIDSGHFIGMEYMDRKSDCKNVVEKF